MCLQAEGKAKSKRERERAGKGACGSLKHLPLRSSCTSSRKWRAPQLRDESGDLAALHVREISAQTISHVHLYSVRKSSFLA